VTPPDHRPSAAELRAAAGRAIEDVIGPGLDVLFVGINPGLYSGATGYHFARPGNRFWRALYLAGYTPRLLAPAEQRELLAFGVGITNLVARTTAAAAELRSDELRAGGDRVRGLVEHLAPRAVAFLGIVTYRTAYDRSDAAAGEQPERIAASRVWVLPNPSGLNAGWPLQRLVEAYREPRIALGLAPRQPLDG
jgi:TDG/mug DNA glycosylase family protein